MNQGTVDWLQFRFPDGEGIDTVWKVNLTFLMSGWECIYGRGCPGHFGVTDRYVTPDLGCCTDGFYIRDDADQKNIEKRISQLTDADWDIKNREYVAKKGWLRKVNKDETKSRVMDGGCVFSNRSDGSTGKPGCAFVQLAKRHGENVDDATIEGHDSHTKYMPGVCHELPLKFNYTEQDKEIPGDYQEVTINAWDASAWVEDDPLREHDDWMAWWCVDAPEAYGNRTPLYVRMEDTMVESMGQAAYNEMDRIILAKQPKVDPMAGAALNGGRPLLPLLIGGRETRRSDNNFDEHLKQMKELQ